MSPQHEFPSDKRDCILGSGQTCKFFQSREKSEKGVFIAAPLKLKALVDLAKSVIKEAGYEPVFATEIREYNRFAFCNNICRPMMEAAIVVVIGDWEGNQGNANVAFEYGIATALGCQVIPIRIKNEAGGPFDMLSLESIILAEDWDDVRRVEDFKREFGAAFEKSRAATELKSVSRELPLPVKAQLNELTSEFWQANDLDTRRLLLFMIRKLGYVSQVYYDESFLEWVADVTVEYAKSFSPDKYPDSRIGSDGLDAVFADLLSAAVSSNAMRKGGQVSSNPQFALALGFLVMSDKVPAFIKGASARSLTSMAEFTQDGSLLVPIFKAVENPRIDDKTYDSMSIPNALRSYLSSAISRGDTAMVLLTFVRKLKSSPDARIQGRAKAIEHELESI